MPLGQERGAVVRGKRELDDLTVLLLVAVAAAVGIVIGCWLGDELGLIF